MSMNSMLLLTVYSPRSMPKYLKRGVKKLPHQSLLVGVLTNQYRLSSNMVMRRNSGFVFTGFMVSRSALLISSSTPVYSTWSSLLVTLDVWSFANRRLDNIFMTILKVGFQIRDWSGIKVELSGKLLGTY
ncbi:uncharacterized protein LOC108824038 [Raphanus sativus]|uniref:Uncharacterized protein LOC108824038 n=1 Tax=Raphanus sativus TaxID=3726 RepID=A0A6J0KZH4_RAPSA|nr:uncharacterized protein LOC108824038 [Raphanus sativus]